MVMESWENHHLGFPPLPLKVPKATTSYLHHHFPPLFLFIEHSPWVSQTHTNTKTILLSKSDQPPQKLITSHGSNSCIAIRTVSIESVEGDAKLNLA